MAAVIKSALVTGGAGFIGSHLVDALVADGTRVIVIDDLSRGRRENLAGAVSAGAELWELDICERQAMSYVLRRERPQVVFHLAAQIDVHSSVGDPGRDALVNVGGTVNLLEGAREAGVQRFVLASTGGAVYGDAAVLPTPETAPAQPISPYGQSKLAAEGYCRLYHHLYALPVSVVRYANVYGPRQDPHGEAGVVAIFSSRLLAGQQPTIYGDGSQTRDYVYVQDVVAATLAAATRGDGGPYNVGTGGETSVLELLAAVRDVTGASLEPIFAGDRAEGVRRSALDAAHAGRDLGWSPGTPLAGGIAATVGWFRDAPGL